MFKDMFTLNGRWGRLNRLRYLGYTLLFIVLMILVSMAIGFLSVTAGMVDGNDPASVAQLSLIINLAVFPVSLWVGICLGVKRWHDLDKSGWYYLLFLVPFINILAGLYTLLAKGTEGDNQYGPDPLKQS